MGRPNRARIEQERPDKPTMLTRTIEPERVLVRETRLSEPAIAEVIQPTTTTYITRGPHQVTDATLKHKCISCGQFRSPSYQKNHPLAPGELPKPKLCSSCAKKRTSCNRSDNQGKSRDRIEHYRLRRRWTSSTGDRVSEFEKGRPLHSARKADGDRNSRRSSLDTKPQIVVSYDGARSRRRTSEYSPERRRVRLVRRIKYVDGRGRSLSRSRSRSRSMSRRHYRRRSRHDETSSSDDHRVRIRVRRIPLRSRSRSVVSRRPLRIVRSRDTSSFDDDYEHIPRHVEKVVELDDDRAGIRSTIRRQSQSMIVEPGTTYAASPIGPFGVDSYQSERPVEVTSYTERVERPPSRTVRIVQVSPEMQDNFHRRRISETVGGQSVYYEPRPPPIITRQIVEPAVQSITQTKIVETGAAPITETHMIDRGERSSPSISETHVVERRGRSRTPVTERHIIERRARSPSHLCGRRVETRSRSRPTVVERDFVESSARSTSSVYETPYRRERRRRVRGRYPSTDSSEEYTPPGISLIYQSTLASTDSPQKNTTASAPEEIQTPIPPCAAS